MTSKEKRLHEILREYGSVCVGYSGGVDSVFLAKTAHDVLGPQHMLAVIGISASFPQVQRDIALNCARDFGIPFTEVRTDEMEDPSYVANPSNRCYFCKTELWSKLLPIAQARGLNVVVDGSNADDVSDHRPGMRAANEHDIRSPLLEAGLTKDEIRVLSKAAGLPTWDMPSAPCLSSRLAYGVSVTRERLQQIEVAEERIRALGFREFRVRHHGNAARLEFAPAEIDRAYQSAAALYEALEDLEFERLLFDVEGYRRGALNELVSIKKANSEIAVLDERPKTVALVGALAARMKAKGYKYVTVELAPPSPQAAAGV